MIIIYIVDVHLLFEENKMRVVLPLVEWYSSNVYIAPTLFIIHIQQVTNV